MKISSKTTYGLRFLIHLAIQEDQHLGQVGQIGKNENMSIKYLENIVSLLRPSGIITVKRGSHGGYKLARLPSEISLKEILETLEGGIIFDENNSIVEKTSADEVIDEFLDDFKNHTLDFLNAKSLADLANKYKIISENQMFYI